MAITSRSGTEAEGSDKASPERRSRPDPAGRQTIFNYLVFMYRSPNGRRELLKLSFDSPIRKSSRVREGFGVQGLGFATTEDQLPGKAPHRPNNAALARNVRDVGVAGCLDRDGGAHARQGP